MSGSKLMELPPEIGLLRQLQRLYAQDTNVLNLPVEIGQLSALEVFRLDSTKLNALFTNIG